MAKQGKPTVVEFDPTQHKSLVDQWGQFNAFVLVNEK